MDLSELEFEGTLWEFIYKGRKEPLIAFLRSDKPLRPSDRAHLADCLEGKVKRKRGAQEVAWHRGKFGFLRGALGPSKPNGARKGNDTGFTTKRLILCWRLTPVWSIEKR